MREHNAVCDNLHAQYPELDDQDLYDKARLVTAALMAKIHTVDWTPAVIAHPTTVLALRANWWGLEGERLDKLLGRLTSNDVLRGIPGSATNHHGVPYSLTEEFVAVYRMHPLIPDDFSLRSIEDDRELRSATLPDVGALQVRGLMTELSTTDLFYSFGTMHPGAITLHNYPRFLQHFDRPDGSLVDLATIDILRSRERGVPRYNQFRRLFHLEPVKSFAEMTDNPEWAEQLRRVYGDVERVDLMVGMYAEPKPAGFGFSDTAFRVFILMASRRLKSDRFFTRDYRPEVYTRAGIDWVEKNSMRSVLLRHFPDLEPALDGVENPFAPWVRTGRGGGLMLSGAARVTLAGIRIANGTAGLFAPSVLSKQARRRGGGRADGLPVPHVRDPDDPDRRRPALARSGGAAPRGTGGPADPRLGHGLGVGGRQAGRAAAEGREDGDDDLGGQPRAGAARKTRLALGSESGRRRPGPFAPPGP